MVMLPFSPHRSLKSNSDIQASASSRLLITVGRSTGKLDSSMYVARKIPKSYLPSPLVIEKSEKIIPEISEGFISRIIWKKFTSENDQVHIARLGGE
jgi:hypothetical protein